MEMADYWILEKQYVHKLFKVLVPRLQHCPISYTRMYRAPKPYPGSDYERAVLELRGHPFPSITPDTYRNRNFIQNVLLDEAKKEYRRQKYMEMAEAMAPMTSGEEANAVRNSESVTTDEACGKSAPNGDSEKSN